MQYARKVNKAWVILPEVPILSIFCWGKLINSRIWGKLDQSINSKVSIYPPNVNSNHIVDLLLHQDFIIRVWVTEWPHTCGQNTNLDLGT